VKSGLAPAARSDYRWQKRKQKLAPYVFVSPFLILFCIFGIYPIIKSVSLSLYATNGPEDMAYVGLGNYKALSGDPEFFTAVKNTVLYALASVFLQLPFALGLALLLTSKWLKGREWYRLAVFSPNLLGQVFVGVIFAQVFSAPYGLLNKFLNWASGGAIPTDTKWLSDPALVLPAIVLTSLWMYVGYNMIYFLAALQGVDKDLYEAATVDGANPWQQFSAVTVPAIKPVITFVLVTATIGSFQLYELPWTLLNSSAGPDNSGLFIITYLYQQGFNAGDLGFASAVGWTLAAGLLVISLIQVKLTGGFNKDA
jgi:ABC-type sugar transport system permease subunit